MAIETQGRNIDAEQRGLAAQGFVGVAAVGAAALISTVSTIGYWLAREDLVLAGTAGVCEALSLVALSFLVSAIRRKHWLTAALAVAFLAGATIFCVYTNELAFRDREQVRLSRALEHDPLYQRALAAVGSATEAMDAELALAPPSCTCPETIKAWSSTRRERLDLLNEQAARARGELDAATPTPKATVDFAMALFLELVKVGRLLVFARPRRAHSSNEPRLEAQVRSSIFKRALFPLAVLGLSLGAAPGAPEPVAATPLRHRPRRAGSNAAVAQRVVVRQTRTCRRWECRGWT